MNIEEKIKQDYQKAAKIKDKVKLAALRLIKSALENKRIEKMKELTEQDVIEVLKSEAKKRKEAIEAFEAGNRQEMAEAEKKELKIIEQYLPKQMSAKQIEAKVKEIIENIPEEQRDFGKVMGMAMKELKGKADGQTVNQAVKKILA
jgi:hypothetical protein